MAERRSLSVGALLDEHGGLCESGYAFSQVKSYDRAAIRANRLRIKEWDYYYFGDDSYAIALTIADNSYMSLGSVSVLDFGSLTYITKSKMGVMTRGRLGFPASIENGDVRFDKGGTHIEFVNDGGRRRLSAVYAGFDGDKGFSCELELEKPTGDHITVATPFAKKKQFYYNTKINCLKGVGRFRVGEDEHEFVGGCGGLDWGRGVWPYKNVWYWSSLSAEVDGTPFGLNLGYGFGSNPATENVIFFGGRAHKLGNVTFDIPRNGKGFDYLKPWRIHDDEGRLELSFYPLIDRHDRMNAIVLATDQHQVFGRFRGEAALDDGTRISVEDKIGFAERVFNKW